MLAIAQPLGVLIRRLTYRLAYVHEIALNEPGSNAEKRAESVSNFVQIQCSD